MRIVCYRSDKDYIVIKDVNVEDVVKLIEALSKSYERVKVIMP